MTIKIEVEIPFEIMQADRASDYLKRALGAIGYAPTASVETVQTSQSTQSSTDATSDSGSTRSGTDATTDNGSSSDGSSPARERGKPSQGRARRTKEEIAEDEAAEKSGPEIASMKMLPDDATPEDVAREFANISSGAEDRIDPENPEVEAQDKADEQAEVATTASNGGPYHDDIRAVLGKYVKAYGIDAAQEDGPKLIGLVCGEGKSKVSDVPDDLIAKVVAGVEEMLTKNPYKREADL